MKNFKKVPRLVSKFYRLRMADSIRKLLEGLPVQGVREVHEGNHVYLGSGEILIGASAYPVKVRIWIHGGRAMASVRSPKAGVEVSGGFDPSQTAEAVRWAVKQALS